LKANVRFGSKADIASNPLNVLPSKADIGTQPLNVRFVPKADIGSRMARGTSQSASVSVI